MPFIWDRGRNPYRINLYSMLRLGSNATPAQIIAQARKISQEIAAGKAVKISGYDLNDYDISDASAKLRDATTQAQELLLVHPQPKASQNKLNTIKSSIRSLANVQEQRHIPQLVDPLAILWFAPNPEPDIAVSPPLADFGLVVATDDEDRLFDVVFDA